MYVRFRISSQINTIQISLRKANYVMYTHLIELCRIDFIYKCALLMPFPINFFRTVPYIH